MMKQDTLGDSDELCSNSNTIAIVSCHKNGYGTTILHYYLLCLVAGYEPSYKLKSVRLNLRLLDVP